ncbi:MAG TPA: sugar phosphate isomerase/epimerase family protein [Dissulfurispiraceae bacterium]|nr:sugar phosphate isomerase/epimerase family protein [Dissulfurispiraceae bacterium]
MTETTRVRIGNQTALSAYSVLQPFQYAVANGFDAFEWFPDKNESGAGWDEDDISRETRIFIRDAAVAGDIRLSVHAPWQLNPLRAGARERFSRITAFARDTGASLINMHFYGGEEIAAFADAIVPIAKLLAPDGIKLSIENTPDNRPEDFNKLFNLLRLTDVPPHVGMCLDLGHANLCEGTRNDYLKFVDMLDPQVPVIHIHVHENYGDNDSHLPLFTGPAGKNQAGIRGFIERIKHRNFSGSIILEQWPQPESLLIEIRTRLLEIIG